MQIEIDKLRAEAEVYNNPTHYSKYVKLERQINILNTQLQENKKDNIEDNNLNSDVLGVSLMQNVSYTNIIIEVCFYLSQAFILYLYRKEAFMINKSVILKPNIIFDYFTCGDYVIIPIYLIILFEGVFLHKVTATLTN